MSFKPGFLHTGIGSVPYTDPQEAVNFVLANCPEVPYWPQLPLRANSEGFLTQFLSPLVKLGLVVTKENKQYFDTSQQEWGAKLAEFYELYMAAMEGDEQALAFFSFPEESAAGFYALVRHLESNGTGEAKYLKGQISGPLTVGLAVTDQDRRAIYYDPQGRDILLKTLAVQGLIQARTLAGFGLPVLVFVDDPGLYASGQSTFITLKKDEIVAELNSIYDAIQGAGALAGTHSCGGMDWSILFESKADIVSFDGFGYFTSVATYVEEMKGFLNRGGCLAWGIVPTAKENLTDRTVQSLRDLLAQHMDYLNKKGIARETLAAQAIITPSCGTGTLTVEYSTKVHQLNRELAQLLRDELK